jgi:hypothetical protein
MSGLSDFGLSHKPINFKRCHRIGVFMDRVISTITENRNQTELKKTNRIRNRTKFIKTEPNRTKYSVIGLDMGLAMKTENRTENRKYINIYNFLCIYIKK